MPKGYTRAASAARAAARGTSGPPGCAGFGQHDGLAGPRPAARRGLRPQAGSQAGDAQRPRRICPAGSERTWEVRRRERLGFGRTHHGNPGSRAATRCPLRQASPAATGRGFHSLPMNSRDHPSASALVAQTHGRPTGLGETPSRPRLLPPRCASVRRSERRAPGASRWNARQPQAPPASADGPVAASRHQSASAGWPGARPDPTPLGVQETAECQGRLDKLQRSRTAARHRVSALRPDARTGAQAPPTASAEGPARETCPGSTVPRSPRLRARARSATTPGSEHAPPPSSDRAGSTGPRRGLTRVTTPMPRGNATGRGASRRSPGIGTPSGGGAGRVGGLPAARCREIT
jgi:hypothetical protein